MINGLKENWMKLKKQMMRKKNILKLHTPQSLLTAH